MPNTASINTILCEDTYWHAYKVLSGDASSNALPCCAAALWQPKVYVGADGAASPRHASAVQARTL